MIHLGTGKPAEPSFPYKHADLAAPTATRREQLAKWMTSRENQYFAPQLVSTGCGLSCSRRRHHRPLIDDIRAGNPASNPELLERLTQEFVSSSFNTQEILRTICKSRSYQASIVPNKWNRDDDINFSHAIARRLPAEVLYDTIAYAPRLRLQGSLPGVPAGHRVGRNCPTWG